MKHDDHILTGRLRILIVNDRIELLETLCFILGGLGFQCRPHLDVASALTGLDASRVDLLITDMLLPSHGGLELIRQARRLNPELPTIGLVDTHGLATKLDLGLLRERVGVHYLLIKPVEPMVLLAIIHQALTCKPPTGLAAPHHHAARGCPGCMRRLGAHRLFDHSEPLRAAI